MLSIKSQNLPFFAPSESVKSSYHEFLESKIPFISILQDTELWNATRDLSASLKNNFETLIVVGIGGSHLGAESFLKALTFPRKVVFLENPDPVGIYRRWSSIEDHSKAHFMFISRSGSTLETSAIANWVISNLKKMDLPVEKHCSVITGTKSSPLRIWAEKENVKSLLFPNELSGRYSVLSPVGVMPLLFGLEESPDEFFKYFFKGAEEALFQIPTALELTTLYKQIIENEFNFFNVWVYSDQMLGFGKWLRQLWSESLGQKNTPQSWNLPSIIMCKGASDQHSYLQQLMAQPKGHVNLVLTLKELDNYKLDQIIDEDHIETKWKFSGKSFFELFNIEAQGLVGAFKKENIPYIHLEMESLDLSSLVQFVLLQQLVISHLGLYAGIDPFVQPEVEQMKSHILELF